MQNWEHVIHTFDLLNMTPKVNYSFCMICFFELCVLCACGSTAMFFEFLVRKRGWSVHFFWRKWYESCFGEMTWRENTLILLEMDRRPCTIPTFRGFDTGLLMERAKSSGRQFCSGIACRPRQISFSKACAIATAAFQPFQRTKGLFAMSLLSCPRSVTWPPASRGCHLLFSC